MISAFVMEKGFYKRLMLLVLPIAAQNLITLTLNFVDIIMLGFLGENELAACSLANTPFFVFILFIFGLTSGSSVLISQYWGKGDKKTINSVFGMGLGAAFIISALVFMLIILFPRQLMSVFTENEVLIELGAKYLKIVALSYIFTALTTTYTATLRSIERPKVGLIINMSAVALSTVLSYILIFGAFGFRKMGIEGAAYAILISRIFEFLLALIYALFLDKHFKIEFKNLFKVKKELLFDFLKITTPVVLNETLWSGGVAMFAIVYGRLGTDVIAAQAIAGNIERLFMVLMIGLANGCAIMVGKELGAKQFKNGYKMAKLLLILSILNGLFAGIVLILSRNLILLPFGISDSAKNVATLFLLFYGLIAPIKYFNCTNIVGVLRSGGDVKWALGIDVLCLWVISVPLAFFVAFVLKLSLIYVIIAILLEEIVKTFIGLWRFLSKKWVNNVTKDFQYDVPVIIEN